MAKPEKRLAHQSDFLLYTASDGMVKIDVFVEQETVWLTQKNLAQLFSVDVRTISEHLCNIFDSKELKESATIRKIRTVQMEGSRNVSRDLEFYNLDAIIAVVHA